MTELNAIIGVRGLPNLPLTVCIPPLLSLFHLRTGANLHVERSVGTLDHGQILMISQHATLCWEVSFTFMCFGSIGQSFSFSIRGRQKGKGQRIPEENTRGEVVFADGVSSQLCHPTCRFWTRRLNANNNFLCRCADLPLISVLWHVYHYLFYYNS